MYISHCYAVTVSLSLRRLRGATVARLTPDQKVACSNHVGVKCFYNKNWVIWTQEICYINKYEQNVISEAFSGMVINFTVYHPSHIPNYFQISSQLMAYFNGFKIFNFSVVFSGNF